MVTTFAKNSFVKPTPTHRFLRKAARRYTADYFQSGHAIETDSETEELKEYLMSDPDLAANVRRFVDNVLIETPTIVSKEGEDVAVRTLKNYNEQLEDVRFYKLARQMAYSLLWNGNAFFEIKFSGKRLKEMYIIDPETIKIKKDKKGGEVVKYEQQVNGSPVASFSPEEIIHISIDNLDSGVWGQSFIKSLKETLKRKALAEYYLHWILQKNKMAPLVNVKADDLSEDQWAHIIQEFDIKAHDPNYTQIVNMNKDDTIEIMKLFSFEDFDDVIKYIEEQKKQIMTLLQVPPIIAGTVDNSNRSNSEIQARLVFYNTIKAFQNVIIEELNFEMLRKLQWVKVRFKFPAIDQRNDVETIKLAKSLRQDLGFTQEAITEFLRENGFKIPKVDKLFEDQLVDLNNAATTISLKGGGDSPSREPRDKTGIPKNEAQRLEDKEMKVTSDAN